MGEVDCFNTLFHVYYISFYFINVILTIECTGHFRMFSVIANIYNKKTEGPTLMELLTATGKLKKSFLRTRDVRHVNHR